MRAYNRTVSLRRAGREIQVELEDFLGDPLWYLYGDPDHYYFERVEDFDDSFDDDLREYELADDEPEHESLEMNIEEDDLGRDDGLWHGDDYLYDDSCDDPLFF